MNNDQAMSAIRAMLLMFGPMIVASGRITGAEYTQLVSTAMTFIGATMALGAFAWGLYVNTHDAKIASVNSLIDSGKALTIQGAVLKVDPIVKG